MPRTPSSSRDSTSRCRCTSSTAGRGRAGWTATATPACPTQLPSADAPLPAHLHVGLHGSAQGRADHARAGPPARRKAGAAAFTGDDVLYCSMPLFHGNALLANLFPAMVSGAAGRASAEVLGVGAAARRPPLRLHVLQLRRAGAVLRARPARAARRRRQPADVVPRLGGVAARPQGVPAAVRLLRGRGLQLQRGRRRDHAVLGDAARRARPTRATGWTSRSSTPTPAPSARGPVRRRPPAAQPCGGDRRDRRSQASCRPSRATTPTPRPPPSADGTGGTGPATSATGTRTAPSTSPGAPPTGCASTARTSRPARSSGSSAASPAWRPPWSTACPTRGPATR